MNLSRIIYSMVAFGIALFIGFKVGENVNPIERIFRSSLHATAMPEVTIPDNNQFNLLIIGVDSVEKTNAKLESIWLAMYLKGTDKVTLVPVFPSPNNPDQNELLADAFRLDGNQPNGEFWEAMQSVGIWWKGYIISDLITAIKMIDAMGGIYVDERLMSGAQIIGNIPSWKDDTRLAVNQQMVLLNGVCERLAQNQTTTLEVINEMFLSQFRGGVQATSFVTKWSSLVATQVNLTCEFPTLLDPQPIKTSVGVSP
jgi:hypothetical protein